MPDFRMTLRDKPGGRKQEVLNRSQSLLSTRKLDVRRAFFADYWPTNGQWIAQRLKMAVRVMLPIYLLVSIVSSDAFGFFFSFPNDRFEQHAL